MLIKKKIILEFVTWKCHAHPAKDCVIFEVWILQGGVGGNADTATAT